MVAGCFQNSFESNNLSLNNQHIYGCPPYLRMPS